MIKCPNCEREQGKPNKTWKYGQFTVQAYSCKNCGTVFREYTRNGKHSFTLKKSNKPRRRGGFVKV